MILAPPPPPARVQVVAQEFRYALSRQTIKAGWAIIELRNQGQDAHDLRMRRVGGKRVYLVADHSELGMTATLRVR